jgi:adenylate cyclase
MRALTLEDLAEESGAPIDLLAWLLERGQLRPLADGRFDARDAAIISTVQALLDAGIDRKDLGWAIDGAGAGLASLGRLFSDPPARSSRAYAELVASLGPAGRRLPAIYAALGLTEPAADMHLRVDEERAIAGFAQVWANVDPEGDADVRVARIAGETSRRLNESWLDAWDATARPRLSSQGAASRPDQTDPIDPTDPEQNASLRGAQVGRELVAWLHERQLERTLNARIIAAFEKVLVEAGRLEARPERPQAVAFVDLSGYTALTVEHGDEAAASVAERLRSLAEKAIRPVDGRLVKELGDGVLILFEDSATAVRATLDLLTRVTEAGLPPAHAGIAAGRVVVRDGDVYGQTVNLASRIAAEAEPGEVVVDEGVVVALPRRTASFAPIGRVELRGFPMPVALWRARAPAGAT